MKFVSRLFYVVLVLAVAVGSAVLARTEFANKVWPTPNRSESPTGVTTAEFEVKDLGRAAMPQVTGQPTQYLHGFNVVWKSGSSQPFFSVELPNGELVGGAIPSGNAGTAGTRAGIPMQPVQALDDCTSVPDCMRKIASHAEQHGDDASPEELATVQQTYRELRKGAEGFASSSPSECTTRVDCMRKMAGLIDAAPAGTVPLDEGLAKIRAIYRKAQQI